MWIYAKYPNQALEIICTSLVMLITLMFGSIKVMQKNLLDHVSTYDSLLNVMKMFPFKNTL